MTSPSPAATAASSSTEVLCVFCGETIVKERSDDPWFHDETGEERCEGVDEFATPAEDDEAESGDEIDGEDGEGSATCTAETGHLPGQDHRWQECPTYHDDDSDDEDSDDEDEEDLCDWCGEPNDDGNGYGGYCGGCADRIEGHNIGGHRPVGEMNDEDDPATGPDSGCPNCNGAGIRWS